MKIFSIMALSLIVTNSYAVSLSEFNSTINNDLQKQIFTDEAFIKKNVPTTRTPASVDDQEEIIEEKHDLKLNAPSNSGAFKNHNTMHGAGKW
jgi:hypothetical protein